MLDNVPHQAPRRARASTSTPAVSPTMPAPRTGSPATGGTDALEVLEVLAPTLGQVRDLDSLDTALTHLARGAVRLLDEVGGAALLVDLGEGWQCRARAGGLASELVIATLPGPLAAREAPAAGLADRPVEGPVETAMESGEMLLLAASGLATRWPALGDVAARHHVRALLCAPLLDRRRARGALLAVVDGVPLTDVGGRLLEALVTAARGALERFVHHQDVAQALVTRSTIGQALGIVMERYDLDHDRAWGYLVRQASTRETKLAVVARELVERRAATRPGTAYDARGPA